MSVYSDPSNPNYFRLDDIAEIRGGLGALRDYIEDNGIADRELVEIVSDLFRTAWPTKQPGFDAAFEADRTFVRQLGVDPR